MSHSRKSWLGGLAAVGLLSLATMMPANGALIAYYDFEGNANDTATGNGAQNLTTSGNGISFTSPGYGSTSQKLTVAGTNDYASNSTNFTAGSSAITLSSWFRTTATGAQSIVFMRIQGGTSDFQSAATLEINSSGQFVGGGRSIVADGFRNVTGTQFAVATNTLYFGSVVLDYANDSVSLYLYNSATNTWTQNTSTVAFGGSSLVGNSNIFVGVRGDLTQDFTGSIDEVRIYNEALTQSQVYGLIPEPSTAGLLAAVSGLLLTLRRRRD